MNYFTKTPKLKLDHDDSQIGCVLMKKITQVFLFVSIIVILGCNKKEEDFQRLVNKGNIEECNKYLKTGVNINAMNEEGFTPLMISIINQNDAMTIFLVKNDAKINMQSGKLGLSPFMIACVKGNKKIADFLLEHGAELNAKDNYGNNVLYDAADRHPEMLDFLIEKGVNINANNKIGVSAIERAVAHGNIVLLKHLIEKGADVNIKRSNGGTPLISAVIGNNPEAAKLLIDNGADVNAIRNDEKTALDFALVILSECKIPEERMKIEKIISLLKDKYAKTGAECRKEKVIFK